jgi:hypothetical protein
MSSLNIVCFQDGTAFGMGEISTHLGWASLNGGVAQHLSLLHWISIKQLGFMSQAPGFTPPIG